MIRSIEAMPFGMPGQFLDRLDDAVEDDHVVDEGRRVDGGAVAQDQGAAEPEDDGDHDGAEAFAHRVGEDLPQEDAAGLVLHGAGDAVEAFLHLLLGPECLDDAQAAEGLFNLRHRVAPQRLGLQGLRFQLAADPAHDPEHEGSEQDGEEGHLPGNENQGAEVEDDQDWVLDQHVQGGRDGSLDFLDVAADAGDDVSFPLLGEEAQGQAEDLAIDFHPDVLDQAGADRDHHGARTEIAGGLEDRHHAEGQAEEQERDGSAVHGHELADVPIDVVEEFRPEIHLRVPGHEFIDFSVDVEQYLEDGDDQRERDQVEDGRQDVQQHRASQVFPVWSDIMPQHGHERFHILSLEI